MKVLVACEYSGTVRGRFSLPIERDLYWTPRPLAEVK